MADAGGSDTVSYRTLLTDSALVSVFLISGIAALGNHSVPVALPAIGETFGLSESEIGLVMSTFAFAVLVAIPVISILADIYGRRAVVIPSLLVFGLSGTATLWADSYGVLLVLRALQGAAFAGTLPLTTTLTGDLYTGAEGSSAQGIRSGLNGLASAVSPIVAGVLAAVAWQYPFVLFAFSIPVAVLVYWYYPEVIEPRDGSGGGPALVAELRGYWVAVRAAANRRLALFMAGGFTLFFLKGGFTTFLPVFVVAGLGATLTAAGTVLGVYGATRVVVSPLSGSVLLRLGRRDTILLGTGVATVGLAAIPWAPDLLWLGLAVAVFALGEAMLNPVLNDAVAASAGIEQRAGIMGGLQILKNASLTLAPASMGAIIGVAGFQTAFLFAAALGAGYGAVILVWFGATAPSAAGVGGS